MTADHRFSTLLEAARSGWQERSCDDSLLSLAMPLAGIDPLPALPHLANSDAFRFLWDCAPGLSIAASGRCQHLELAGLRRFELAQRFCDVTLGRLIDATATTPPQARPRVLLAFSFFEQSDERHSLPGSVPSVQAVLPRWQLSRQGQRGWLRINGAVSDIADARELAEQLWLKTRELETNHGSAPIETAASISIPGRLAARPWQDCYRQALDRALELVNGAELHKLVLAVRQSIDLEEPLDALPLLQRLRRQQAGSCRFLWQRQSGDAFFGASPERLLCLRGENLRIDALAGTAGRGDDGSQLLRSDKDRREQELVVETITGRLEQAGLNPWHRRQPQLARHGLLTHLHTPITADAAGRSALALAEELHPTPAVAGLPRRKAMAWLRALEPFERGGYAAPIGWIDSAGDAELRVAIRCGHARGNRLDLTAGAGLVRGSVAERELQEVGLKLAVLADQLDLQAGAQVSSRSRSIT